MAPLSPFYVLHTRTSAVHSFSYTNTLVQEILIALGFAFVYQTRSTLLHIPNSSRLTLQLGKALPC